MKIDATSASETSVNIHQSTRCHSPEDFNPTRNSSTTITSKRDLKTSMKGGAQLSAWANFSYNLRQTVSEYKRKQQALRNVCNV